MELYAKGAEANLYLDEGVLVKERVRKEYRIPELDLRLRKRRTQREAKLLENVARIGVSTPRVHRVDPGRYSIHMEYIEGTSLKDFFEGPCSPEEIRSISLKIGRSISRMHDANIEHNDLTTSNMLLKDGEVYFIDFGLGSTSTRVEDKAMDLVVLKKSLYVSHPSRCKEIWAALVDRYQGTRQYDLIIKRVAVIERRVRYSSAV